MFCLQLRMTCRDVQLGSFELHDLLQSSQEWSPVTCGAQFLLRVARHAHLAGGLSFDLQGIQDGVARQVAHALSAEVGFDHLDLVLREPCVDRLQALAE